MFYLNIEVDREDVSKLILTTNGKNIFRKLTRKINDTAGNFIGISVLAVRCVTSNLAHSIETHPGDVASSVRLTTN